MGEGKWLNDPILSVRLLAMLHLQQRLQMRGLVHWPWQGLLLYTTLTWQKHHGRVLLFFSKAETGIYFGAVFGDGALAENIMIRNF